MTGSFIIIDHSASMTMPGVLQAVVADIAANEAPDTPFAAVTSPELDGRHEIMASGVAAKASVLATRPHPAYIGALPDAIARLAPRDARVVVHTDGDPNHGADLVAALSGRPHEVVLTLRPDHDARTATRGLAGLSCRIVRTA